MLLDVDVRIHRDVQTFPDPKTRSERAQNWADQAKALEAERDGLERMSFRDEQLARWALRLADELPFHAQVARRLAEAIREEDWNSAAQLQATWDLREERISGIGEDARAYCGEP
jgi:hypothetical protein